MTDLPALVLTDQGYTVPDAGPDLLKELLVRVSEVLAVSPRISGLIRPGLDERTIRAEFDAIGVVPCEEALVWWGHWNGFVLGAIGGFGSHALELAKAMTAYRDQIQSDDEYGWRPEWVQVQGSGTIALSNRPDETVPRVRLVNTWVPGATLVPSDVSHQCLSLSTLMTMKLTAIELGLIHYDPNDDIWDREDFRFVDELPHWVDYELI